MFSAVLTPGPNATSDDTESVNAGLYYIGWALRAYHDEFTSDPQLPLLLLQGLLTVPIQFSTLAWEWINATSVINTTEFALPPDLETTASRAEVTYRAKANPWTVFVFIALTAILLIWCNCLLLWILAQNTPSPNLSSFVEVDIGSKSTYSSISQYDPIQDVQESMLTVEDFATMLRRAGLGNAENSAVIQCLKDRRIRVAGVGRDENEKSLVLVTGTGKDLQETENLNRLRRGVIYE